MIAWPLLLLVTYGCVSVAIGDWPGWDEFVMPMIVVTVVWALAILWRVL